MIEPIGYLSPSEAERAAGGLHAGRVAVITGPETAEPRVGVYLEAPPVPSPAYGGVRALDWRPYGMLGTTAKTPFGGYHISEDLSLGCIWLERQKYPTLEEAKAAAQADFERRVLSCLSPVAVEEADAEVVAWQIGEKGAVYRTEAEAWAHVNGWRNSEIAGSYTCPDPRPLYAVPYTPSPQIGKAGAGPVGKAVAWKYEKNGNVFINEYDHPWKVDEGWKITPLGPLDARPVEEPGEVERLTRERDEAMQNAQDLALDLASAYEKIAGAKHREAALTETQERLEEREKALRKIAQETSDDVMTYSLESCRSIARAALTGDAQEART